MAISLLRLSNLRCYLKAEFRPGPHTTVVTGANGSGKSTILEAASLFATLVSPRTGHLGVLVRHGEEEAGAHLETDGGTTLEIRLRGGRALLRVGGSGAIARTFLGRFRAILFTPEDLDLVRGEPELRRRALDDFMVQLRPGYRGVRQEFERALRQRNAALRQGSAESAAAYDVPLAAAAAQVVAARRTLVTDLSPHAARLYEELAGSGRLAIEYLDRCGAGDLDGDALERFFLDRFARDLDVELERGTTRAGPHRDDLEIGVDGVSARSFASRGEQRTAALALRLAELRMLPDAVLLMDDVLSELDAERRGRLFAVAGERQTVVTTADRGAVPAVAAVDAVWMVEAGELHEGG